jgi:hypothetical protein
MWEGLKDWWSLLFGPFDEEEEEGWPEGTKAICGECNGFLIFKEGHWRHRHPIDEEHQGVPARGTILEPGEDPIGDPWEEWRLKRR